MNEREKENKRAIGWSGSRGWWRFVGKKSKYKICSRLRFAYVESADFCSPFLSHTHKHAHSTFTYSIDNTTPTSIQAIDYKTSNSQHWSYCQWTVKTWRLHTFNHFSSTCTQLYINWFCRTFTLMEYFMMRFSYKQLGFMTYACSACDHEPMKFRFSRLQSCSALFRQCILWPSN